LKCWNYDDAWSILNGHKTMKPYLFGKSSSEQHCSRVLAFNSSSTRQCRRLQTHRKNCEITEVQKETFLTIKINRHDPKRSYAVKITIKCSQSAVSWNYCELGTIFRMKIAIIQPYLNQKSRNRIHSLVGSGS